MPDTLKNQNINRLTKESLKELSSFFNTEFKTEGNSFTFNIQNTKNKASISLDILIEDSEDILISVYSENSHLQLQSCDGFIVSEMLEEVIFYSDCNTKISGLIISKQGDCALYSNVDKSILRKDFMDLNSEKLLSAVALSILDSLNN